MPLRGVPLGRITILVALALGLAPAHALAFADSGFGSARADSATAQAQGSAPASVGGAGQVLVGAGDIASCNNKHDSATARLIESIDGIVFTAGDNVYPDGSRYYFRHCYRPTWGVFKARTRPVPGNHDYYRNPGAAAYFRYFGANAGPAGLGYYAYDAGTWRVYALNSECAKSSTCYADQLAWLQADLAANPRQCTMAIWHRPLYSTGPHGNSARMSEVFSVLYDSGAEIVVNGHDHMYERYTPLDASGNPDPANGIREFVVGTGGGSLYAFRTTSPLIEARANNSYGVLMLDLQPGGYSWQFLPAGKGTFTDSGTGTCH